MGDQSLLRDAISAIDEDLPAVKLGFPYNVGRIKQSSSRPHHLPPTKLMKLFAEDLVSSLLF